MEIDRKLVEYLANLSRLSIREDEVALYQKQINEILHLMEKLNEVDTASVPETAHVQQLSNVLRSDEPASSTPRDEVLKNAPMPRDGAFSVPRVLP